MSYSHNMNLTAILRDDVPYDQIVKTIEPILEYWDIEPDPENIEVNDQSDIQIKLGRNDQGKLELYIYTAGDVGDSYRNIVRNVAKQLGEIAAEGGSMKLVDEDSVNPDAATETIFFGPDPDAMRNFQLSYVKNKAVDLFSDIDPGIAEKVREALDQILAQ